jgi:hypothetical protein
MTILKDITTGSHGNGYHLDNETGKIIETKTGGTTKDKGPIPVCWSCTQLLLKKKVY